MIKIKTIWIQFISVAVLALLTFGCADNDNKTAREQERVINDSSLQIILVKEFKTHPYISSGAILTKIEDGIVTLYGSADNLLEKQKAEDLVSMVKGVKGVINLLVVETNPVDDQQIKERVDKALIYDPVLRTNKIDVEVDSGVVNLNGMVKSWHQKRLATDIIMTVKGVKGVNNNIAFVYDDDRPDEDVRANIKSLLRHDIRIKDGMIDVFVEDSKVSLSGKVASSAEKSMTIVHAWVPGVDTVVATDIEVSSSALDTLMRTNKYVSQSDDMIIKAVEEALFQDPRLSNHRVKVIASKGNVTLSGKVDNLRAKYAAADDAASIVGVWSVENNIVVEPELIPERTVLVDNAVDAIEQHPLFEDYAIIVGQDDDGNITLTGDVKYGFEKRQVEDLVAGIPGVVNINNQIQVKEGLDFPYAVTPETINLPVIKKTGVVDDEQIKEDVADQLWWSPSVDSDRILIEVEDGVVTLSGSVSTSVEMDNAVKNAYEGGALQVVNKLAVDFWEKE